MSQDMNQQTEERNKTAEAKRPAPAGRRRKRRFGAGFAAGALSVLLIGICAWGAIGILRGGFPFGTYASGQVSENDVSAKLDLLNSLIDQYYLYEGEVDEDALAEGIYSGYTAALGDPYTEYYDREETAALMESTSGEFSGIGATMTQNTDGPGAVITAVYEGSPAAEAGLQAGDVISKVDGNDVSGMDLDSIVSLIKGEKGTEVKITVLRYGQEIETAAVRDIIQMQTVDSVMLDDQVGYISVSEFDDVTYDQFKSALDSLEAQGMAGLVIDLRNNPGGNLDTVTDMLKLLLPEGPIVSITDKNGDTEEITCDGSNEFTKPLAVLVNQYSASASEVFCGAVQDYGIGSIVGVTTFGKGVVQQLMDLGDGTCLKVTIAEYYTPSGRSINALVALTRSSSALRAKTAYVGGGYEFHSHSGTGIYLLHASMTLPIPVPEYGVNCNAGIIQPARFVKKTVAIEKMLC